MRRLSFAAVILLAVAPVQGSAQVAPDQNRTGSRVGDTAAYVTSPNDISLSPKDQAAEVRARIVAYKTADCMMESHAETAKAWLVSDKVPGERFSRGMGFCLGAHTFDMDSSSLSFPIGLWKGALAEAYLRHERSPLPNAEPSSVVAASHDWTREKGIDPVVADMAVCIAQTHPEAIGALLAAKVGSPEEAGELHAISPLMGPCLVKGATLKTDPTNLRAVLALALFHRDFDPSPDAVPSKTAETN